MFPMNMIPNMTSQTLCTCFYCSVNQPFVTDRKVCMSYCYPSVHVVPTSTVVPPQSRTSGDPYGGGFHQFFKQHPDLEQSKCHIYAKKIPEESREHIPFGSNRPSSFNKPLNTSYNFPAPQRVDPKVQERWNLTSPMANSTNGYNGFNSPEKVASFSLDMELERRIQETIPQSASIGSGYHSSTHDAFLQESGHEDSLNEDKFYSIVEADKSIVLCVPNDSSSNFPVHSGERVPESASTFESITSVKEDRSTSPICFLSTCDAVVGTEQTSTTSAMSQTETPRMTDKHVNTEVYMLDLDFLTKKFITMKSERDELLEKVKMQRTNSPLAKVINDLKELETDYSKMREKILLPLSNPTKAKMCDISLLQSFQRHESTVNNESAAVSDRHSSLESETMRDKAGKDLGNIQRAVAHVVKEQCSAKITEGKPPDVNSNEAWYDAEEELPSEVREETKVDEKHHSRGNATEFTSAGLCVSGLPRNVTENDVLMWFEKYHPLEVHISKLRELSVAIVIVGSHHCAEAAVKELSGLRIKAHTLQVECINIGRPEAKGQSCKCVSVRLNDPSRSQYQLTASPGSSVKKKVVSVSPTAQGTFVPQHYGTMGSFDILMSELTQRHPSVGRQRILDALLELRAKYRGVLSGLPLRTIRDMISDILTRPICNTSY